MNETKHGHYSQRAAEKFGSHLYSTPEGDQVEVTVVGLDPSAERYQWHDKVYVGEVTTWIGRCRAGSIKLPEFHNIIRTR